MTKLFTRPTETVFMWKLVAEGLPFFLIFAGFLFLDQGLTLNWIIIPCILTGFICGVAASKVRKAEHGWESWYHSFVIWVGKLFKAQ